MEVHLLDKKKELSSFVDSKYPGRTVVCIVDSKVRLFHADVVDAMNPFPMFAGEKAKSIVGVMDFKIS